MAKKGQQIFEREASSDLGGDPKFSGWSPTLDTVVKPLPGGALLHPTKSSAGPITVAEFGRNSDGGVGLFQGPSIRVMTGRTRRRADGSVATSKNRQSRKQKRWNGVTRGKGTASRAVDAMDNELAEIPDRHVRKALVKRFHVT